MKEIHRDVPMKILNGSFLEIYFKIPVTRYASVAEMGGNKGKAAGFYRYLQKFLEYGLVEKDLHFNEGTHRHKFAKRSVGFKRKYTFIKIYDNGIVMFGKG